jgi:hypothetical protein
VVGVDVSLDDPGGTELDHGLVVAFGALAAAFPAVHPLAVFGVLVRDEDPATRLQQVFLAGEELVAGSQAPAVAPTAS